MTNCRPLVESCCCWIRLLFWEIPYAMCATEGTATVRISPLPVACRAINWWGSSFISTVLQSWSSDMGSVISGSESTFDFLHWRVQIVSTEFSPDAVGSLDWFTFHTLHFHPHYRAAPFSSPPQFVHSVCARPSEAVRQNVSKCDVRSVPCVWNWVRLGAGGDVECWMVCLGQGRREEMTGNLRQLRWITEWFHLGIYWTVVVGTCTVVVSCTVVVTCTVVVSCTVVTCTVIVLSCTVVTCTVVLELVLWL
jgi:hypothetical protein